jgi:hypothetical protein
MIIATVLLWAKRHTGSTHHKNATSNAIKLKFRLNTLPPIYSLYYFPPKNNQIKTLCSTFAAEG